MRAFYFGGLLALIVTALLGSTASAQALPVSPANNSRPAATAPAAQAQSQAASLPWVPTHDAHPLLAYYYAWWEPEKISSGWAFTPSQVYPVGVRQLVNSPDLLRQHMAEAQQAGIDGFIVNRSVDLRALLDVAKGSDFRLSLQVNVEAGDPAGQIMTYYQFIDSPSLVRYQGQPVLFFWRAGARSNEFWSALRAQVDPDHHALWIADGDNFTIIASDVWDGISPYAIAWAPSPQSQLPAWAAKARAVAPEKLFIPPVSPGCDDHIVRSTTCLRDRADGAYYRATFAGALASSPPWAIVVSTWNEWLEATQIEPAKEYGDEYLQLTRELADNWRGDTLLQQQLDIPATDSGGE